MASGVLIYLVRHGLADARGPKYPDDDLRPLTDRGKARLREQAAGLLALDVRFDEILTSPLVRTRQTAEVLAAAFARKPKITEYAALAPGGRAVDVLAGLDEYARRKHLALVGHAPGIGQVAARLIGARHGIEFKKGAVCCVEVAALPLTGPGELRWFLTPRMLRTLGKTG
jgi:phosphohistidine phosphatase